LRLELGHFQELKPGFKLTLLGGLRRGVSALVGGVVVAGLANQIGLAQARQLALHETSQANSLRYI